jgi:hypothetical protein
VLASILGWRLVGMLIRGIGQVDWHTSWEHDW